MVARFGWVYASSSPQHMIVDIDLRQYLAHSSPRVGGSPLYRITPAICLAVMLSPSLLRACRYKRPKRPKVVRSEADPLGGQGSIPWSRMWSSSLPAAVPTFRVILNGILLSLPYYT